MNVLVEQEENGRYWSHNSCLKTLSASFWNEARRMFKDEFGGRLDTEEIEI